MSLNDTVILDMTLTLLTVMRISCQCFSVMPAVYLPQKRKQSQLYCVIHQGLAQQTNQLMYHVTENKERSGLEKLVAHPSLL